MHNNTTPTSPLKVKLLAPSSAPRGLHRRPRSADGSVKLQSVDATTGEPCPGFLPGHAAGSRRRRPRRRAGLSGVPGLERRTSRAQFLDAIADELDALSDNFVELVCPRNRMPAARIKGERGRTSGQMRLFATVLRRGDLAGARIDKALPDRRTTAAS